MTLMTLMTLILTDFVKLRSYAKLHKEYSL